MNPLSVSGISGQGLSVDGKQSQQSPQSGTPSASASVQPQPQR